MEEERERTKRREEREKTLPGPSSPPSFIRREERRGSGEISQTVGGGGILSLYAMPLTQSTPPEHERGRRASKKGNLFEERGRRRNNLCRKWAEYVRE